MSACAGGKVERVWQDNELGLCVLIDHENGYETLYAGLSSADYVQAGDPVIQGQTLGAGGKRWSAASASGSAQERPAGGSAGSVFRP